MAIRLSCSSLHGLLLYNTSQQEPQSPALTAALETTTDEQPPSQSQPSEETFNQGEDNNSNPGDTATPEEGQESASEGSSNEE